MSADIVYLGIIIAKLFFWLFVIVIPLYLIGWSIVYILSWTCSLMVKRAGDDAGSTK